VNKFSRFICELDGIGLVGLSIMGTFIIAITYIVIELL